MSLSKLQANMRLVNNPLLLAKNDLPGEEEWEVTVVESAPVRQRWVFAVERKVYASTLALRRSSQ